MSTSYDRIGIDYSALRKPDPRLARAIHAALGDASTVVNVGAGTGAYEPTDRDVTAVEPSSEMIRQRAPDAARVVQASAEALPFDDASFDAAMAILTIHHWTDKARGLRELRRVSRGPVVLFTFDPNVQPWLTDYLPALATLDAAQMPTLAEYEAGLGPVTVTEVPIPHDCVDGFLYAYWRRPEAYLDPFLRRGSSSFWRLEDLDAGLEQLRADLDSGAWAQRYADVLARDTYDAGYRLIVSGG